MRKGSSVIFALAVSAVFMIGAFGTIANSADARGEYLNISTTSVLCEVNGLSVTKVGVGQAFTVKSDIYQDNSAGVSKNGVYSRLWIDTNQIGDTAPITMQWATHYSQTWTNVVIGTAGTHTIKVMVNPGRTGEYLGRIGDAYADNTVTMTISVNTEKWTEIQTLVYKYDPYKNDPLQSYWQDHWRLFARDVNGDGIIDSTNLYADACYFADAIVGGNKYVTKMLRPAEATFWLELRGFAPTGAFTYDSQGSNYCWPIVKPSGPGCYYAERSILLHVKTNAIGNDVVSFPNHGTAGTHQVKIIGMKISNGRTGGWFVNAIPVTNQNLVQALDGPIYKRYTSNANLYAGDTVWPARGSGNDISRNFGASPDISAFANIVICSLQTWPSTASGTSAVIYFSGTFDASYYGSDTSSGTMWDEKVLTTIGGKFAFSFQY